MPHGDININTVCVEFEVTWIYDRKWPLGHLISLHLLGEVLRLKVFAVTRYRCFLDIGHV